MLREHLKRGLAYFSVLDMLTEGGILLPAMPISALAAPPAGPPIATKGAAILKPIPNALNTPEVLLRTSTCFLMSGSAISAITVEMLRELVRVAPPKRF